MARLGTLVAAAVCVAGMALGDIDRHFAWQMWHLLTSTFTCVAPMAFLAEQHGLDVFGTRSIVEFAATFGNSRFRATCG